MARLGLFALRSGQWGKTIWANPDNQFSTYPTHFNEVGDGYLVTRLDWTLGLRHALVGVGKLPNTPATS